MISIFGFANFSMFRAIVYVKIISSMEIFSNCMLQNNSAGNISIQHLIYPGR